jgi:hypothetical protein
MRSPRNQRSQHEARRNHRGIEKQDQIKHPQDLVLTILIWSTLVTGKQSVSFF